MGEIEVLFLSTILIIVRCETSKYETKKKKKGRKKEKQRKLQM